MGAREAWCLQGRLGSREAVAGVGKPGTNGVYRVGLQGTPLTHTCTMHACPKQVALQLVPRIDYQRLALSAEERKAVKRTGRPLPKYFNVQEIKSVLRKSAENAAFKSGDNVASIKRRTANSNQVTEYQAADASLPEYMKAVAMEGDGDSEASSLVYKFQNKFFHNGFVYLETNSDFVVRALQGRRGPCARVVRLTSAHAAHASRCEQDAEAPQPTLDELQMFRNRKDDPGEGDSDGKPVWGAGRSPFPRCRHG